MIADLQARQQALDPHQSFIVQAPAGSGKTGLLVYRILTLLSHVQRPEQILAITFTNKATAEMRQRIMQLLNMANNKVTSTDAFEQQGIDLAHAVLKRDKQLGWQLLALPQQLQIQTIDAFCAKLTGHMPWLSRLGAKPHTTENAYVHYDAVVEQLLSELTVADSTIGAALKVVMLELDFDYRKARSMFVSMLAKRDQWLRHLWQNDLPSLRPVLEQAWRNISEQLLALLDEIFPIAHKQTLLDCAKVAAVEFAKTNPDKANPLAACIKLVKFPSAQVEDIDVWQGLKFLLFTKTNTIRKKVTITQGFIAKADYTNKMNALLLDFAEQQALIDAFVELDSLPPIKYSDANWRQLLALEQVLKALAALLQLRFRAVGECDFSEVTQRANLALQALQTPTDLALRMDYQLQHILVDEFQDTAYAQLELLKKLTAGWQMQSAEIPHNQTLFLVGDPMQSIYRFREAEVGLFLQVVQDAQQAMMATNVFTNVRLHALTLSHNFRSTDNLVNWFNQTFASSFPTQQNLLRGAIKYTSSTSNQAEIFPSVVYQPVLTKQQEASAVVSQINAAQQHALARGKTPNIAVLVRSRTHLDSILPTLKMASIDYIGVDIQPLNQTQAVLDVLALCKAICRLTDKLSWLALLRGPWCGLTLAEIKQLLSKPYSSNQHFTNEQQTPVWWQIQSADLDQFTQDSRHRLQRFIDIMHTALAQRQQVALWQIVDWAWQQFGGSETLFSASIDDVQVVIDLIRKQERGGDIESIDKLEAALDGLYAKPPTNNCATVTVSTIHKSKGLQYDTVILAGLSNQGANDDKDILMWAEDLTSQGQRNLLLAPIQYGTQHATHHDYLRKLEQQRTINEQMRLMYVACTRAETTLVLLAVIKHNPKGDILKPQKSTLLSSVWSALETQFEIAKDQSATEQTNTEVSQQLYRLPSDYHKTYPPAVAWQFQTQLNTQPLIAFDDTDTLEFSWASELAKAVGIVLHNWLQFNLHRLTDIIINDDLKQQWRNQLMINLIPYSQLTQGVKRIEQAVKNMQDDTNAHFIFQHYPIQANEYTISTLDNGLVKNYRLDRTFVDADNVRWIIDYKTTVTNSDNVEEFVDQQIEQRHKPQLEKYGELMSKMEQRHIKLGVYYPLLKIFRSWDYRHKLSDTL